MTIVRQDKCRKGVMPLFQYTLRWYDALPRWLRGIVRLFHKLFLWMYKCDIPLGVKIGEGLYIGHPFCISINQDTVMGRNCNIHKGVTLGCENRGRRKGAPSIGNDVWIGVNATVVGKITVGDDVLIAPNSFVNFDVPSHSIVVGNPGVVYLREGATCGYINNRVK